MPWEDRSWDQFVDSHPGATVYHTSAWGRIIRDAGNYEPCFLTLRDGDRLRGLLPLLYVKSRLTGNRLVSLPFSDVCYPLTDGPEADCLLLERALELSREKRAGFVEIRGLPASSEARAPVKAKDPGETHVPADAPVQSRPETDPGDSTEAELPESLGFAVQRHFQNYIVPLSGDADAVRMTFSRKSIRQTISKSAKLGVTVRLGEGRKDLDEFYRLYLLNRRRHGIPPQPIRFFAGILERLSDHPKALLYLAEFEGQAAAALIVLRYRNVCYAKYEGVDESFRQVFPVNTLFWKTIEDACAAGDAAYDFGRTALDNRGLSEFKSRWGTACTSLPYCFFPPREGLSVVKSNSLKYRLFTGLVKRLPASINTRLGAKLFRHFG